MSGSLKITLGGEAGMVRLLLGIRWQADHTERRAHPKFRVRRRGALGHGWAGLQTYLAGPRLLTTLG